MEDDYDYEPETASEHFLAGKGEQPGKSKLSTEAITSASFDWQGLAIALGESQSACGDSETFERMGQGLAVILRWLCHVRRDARLDLVGRRVIALTWALNPDLHDGDPSAAELAKRFRCHKAMLSEDAAEARRKFGLKNRASAHAWNFKPEPTAPVDKPINPPV